MKKFILMLFAVFMAFSSMAQALPSNDGYCENHGVAADVTPGLNIAMASAISVDRMCLAGGCVDKETTNDYQDMTAAIIGAGSGDVRGGGIIGAIRS